MKKEAFDKSLFSNLRETIEKEPGIKLQKVVSAVADITLKEEVPINIKIPKTLKKEIDFFSVRCDISIKQLFINAVMDYMKQNEQAGK